MYGILDWLPSMSKIYFMPIPVSLFFILEEGSMTQNENSFVCHCPEVTDKNVHCFCQFHALQLKETFLRIVTWPSSTPCLCALLIEIVVQTQREQTCTSRGFLHVSSFGMGLTSAQGQKLECLEIIINNIFINKLKSSKPIIP